MKALSPGDFDWWFNMIEAFLIFTAIVGCLLRYNREAGKHVLIAFLLWWLVFGGFDVASFLYVSLFT
jgi:hypothetical protein